MVPTTKLALEVLDERSTKVVSCVKTQSDIVSELILGGQKSGKSARAEFLAQQWLQADEQHRGIFIATAQAWDTEMQARIARHQIDRAQSLPQMQTLEEPLTIAALIREHSQPETLIVVDCMTLWLSNIMMPVESATLTNKFNGASQIASFNSQTLQEKLNDLFDALRHAVGPVVLVSNEIGLGVIPMGAEVRAYVDQLGKLNQMLGAHVTRVSWMVAGFPVLVKDANAVTSEGQQ